MKFTVVGLVVGLLLAGSTRASAEGTVSLWPVAPAHNPLRVCWIDPCAGRVSPSALAPRFQLPAALPALAPVADDAPQTARRVVIEYSDAYRLRRRIHRYASFATLPLFAAEYALGQSLYNNTPADHSSTKGLHGAVGAGIVGLIGVNTVTGAWNMFGEGRKDPHGRTLRLVHGLLMMVADAGFVATSVSAPNSERRSGNLTYESSKATHRNLAVASIGVGTVGYLVMLFGNR